jgi:hypothetical protein
LAIKQKILLVSFTPSHEKHNDRLVKLLQGGFQVEHYTLVSPNFKVVFALKGRHLASTIFHHFSVGLITFILFFVQVVTLKFGRKQSTKILSKMLESYFSEGREVITKVFQLNKTLRRQKNMIDLSKKVISFAIASRASCVLLPEDNNYYGIGHIISGLLKNGIDVGVIEFTSGMESEFEQTRSFFTSDMSPISYRIFSKLFLSPVVYSRWKIYSEFMSCFPGSLETNSNYFLKPSIMSGLANFYLTTTDADLSYLKDHVNSNSQVSLTEPIEVTLANKSINNSHRSIFGVFLPPDQFTNVTVKKRLAASNTDSYAQLITKIVDVSRSICEVSDELVFFPHPRMFISHSELIEDLSRDFRVIPDYSSVLGEIRYALIFSSAVFTALLSASVRVFNLDVYGYNYQGLFPKDNSDFTQISTIEDIGYFARDFAGISQSTNHDRISVTEFLESRLLI